MWARARHPARGTGLRQSFAGRDHACRPGSFLMCAASTALRSGDIDAVSQVRPVVGGLLTGPR